MKLPFELQPDEEVAVFRRRHWIYLTSKLALIVLIWLVPAAAVLWVLHITAGLDGLPGKIAWAVAGLWSLYWLIRGYFSWYRYQNDIWVVTNQRIIDITKFHWFKQRIASADLVDVEDINVVREGVLPTVFNFGDVRCQTAGEVPNFVLSGIPEPAKVLATVDSLRDAARRTLMRPLP